MKLKQCPFCGGEAHTTETACTGNRWGALCVCGASVRFYAKEQDAIEAWNTRSVMAAVDMDYVRDIIERHSDEMGGNSRDFHNGAYAAIAEELNARAERTCRMEICHNMNGEAWIECSECRWQDPDPGWNRLTYCPNCGAKVVE